MAEAPPSGGGGGAVKAITRKVGPLPLWAYAAILVVGYFLYRRMKGGSGSSTGGTSSGAPAYSDQAYVPGSDQSGGGGGEGGGIGATSLPGTVNNYYYGDLAYQQANGGGTAPASGIAPPKSPTGVMTPGGGLQPGPVTGPGPIGIHYFGPGGSGVYYPPVVQPVSAPAPKPYVAPQPVYGNVGYHPAVAV